MLLTACGQSTSSKGTETQKSTETVSQTTQTGTETTGTETSQVPSYFNETGYPIVNEEITIKVLALKHASVVDFENLEDSPAWKYLSELFGVKFEFEEYLKADMATKMPLIMADPKSMPDLFWRVNEADKNIDAYAANGLFLDLDPYLEYMPNLQAAWNSDPNYEYAARSVDGQVYTLPSYASNYNPNSFYVNTTWMENCGIETLPTNLDEFKEMLIKFRDMDANGNGDPNDEIPLKGSLNDGLLCVLANTTGMLAWNPTTGVMYSVDDGETEVDAVFMDERYRYIVEFFAELYDEGLVDQDMFTVDTAEMKARKDNDRYGVYPGTVNSVKISDGKDISDQFTMIPLLTSDYLEANAEGIVDKGVVAPVNLNDVGMVSAYTEYPEVCARIMDFMYSADGSALFGFLDPAQYDFEAAGVSPEVIEILETGYARTDGKNQPANICGYYGPRWMQQIGQHKINMKTNEYLSKSVYERIYLPYTATGNVRTCFTNVLKFNNDEAEVITQYKTDIDILVKDKLAAWITGAEKLNDDTWAAYIKTLKSMNVDAMNAAYQSAYDRLAALQE